MTANRLDNTAKELLIDVSEYEAPRPFEEVVKLVSQLKSGEYIRMLHRKEPLPLIQMLQENGYECRMFPGQQVEWEIIIWNSQDISVQEFCLMNFSNSPAK
ncbi:MAG: DUF2249 domain-containing protein [gamma proteobacterium symbiont of Taylorina sp.]|nr:DUF2249 domain-containing protein [gamma proteobacterium symbiont of Taylorina sp.]